MRIPVEISARHIHLSQKDFEKLFGKNKKLIEIKKLSQTGEFASDDRIILLNENNRIKNVRILGPFRKNSQVEISMTDAHYLKLNPIPKIKVSGDLADTKGILVKGPKSSLKIQCIIAQRHLHASVKEAKKLGIKNNQKISVKILGKRELTFHNIITRISKNYKISLHLDTDEGNAAGIQGKIFGEIVKK